MEGCSPRRKLRWPTIDVPTGITWVPTKVHKLTSRVNQGDVAWNLNGLTVGMSVRVVRSPRVWSNRISYVWNKLGFNLEPFKTRSCPVDTVWINWVPEGVESSWNTNWTSD
jgi:hypothetical protein